MCISISTCIGKNRESHPFEKAQATHETHTKKKWVEKICTQ